jgi:hypothetical protein
MVCPVWNGIDTAGRSVCPDSFYTKRAGCNSAEDRVVVENNVSRPQYLEYITLSAGGINGEIYGATGEYGDTMAHLQSAGRTAMLSNVHNITGQFGNVTGFGAERQESCATYPRLQAEDQVAAVAAQQNRKAVAAQEGYRANQFRQASGF